MTNTENNVSNYIQFKPKGTLLFPDDFSHLGTPAAIRKALQRLKEKGVIKSVTHGIYIRPKTNKLIDEVMPSKKEVAKAIAKRDKVRILPAESYALNKLGLSTQVPMNAVFLTDGAARKIKIDYGMITFKRTTPKNLATIGKISGLVIQALKEIAKERLKNGKRTK